MSTDGLIWYEGEDAAAMRSEFARLRAAHPFINPFTLGQQVFKGKRDALTRAAAAVTVWHDDAALLTETRNATGNDVVLPMSKEDMARMYAGLISRTKDNAIELKALDGMAEVLGFKGKMGAAPATPANVTNNIDNRKVEYVTIYGDEATSQAAAMAQQRRLIEEAQATIEPPVSDEAKGAYALMARPA